MHRRRSVSGLAVLCALVLGAFAEDAPAEQRAFTCSVNAGSRAFADSHCQGNKGISYGHQLIEGSTLIAGSNAKTASETTAAAVSSLKGAIAGLETEVRCTTVGGSGSLSNKETFVEGTGGIEYTGCTVTKPAEKGCVVKGGKITTNTLAATTSGQAANTVKFTPFIGTEFAPVSIEKCTAAALNKTFPVTGSLIATASGATLTTTHAGITTQNTLKFGGGKAGLEGTLTVTMAGFGEAITLT